MAKAPRDSAEVLAESYLSLLLEARHREATALVMSAVESGEIGIRQLYLEVFEPVLHEVGRLWESNQVSIAQEHFVSATTQQVIARLYPRIFTTERRGWRMVAACAGPELHELGLRMVTDFFEIEGWDTYYLGANLPNSAIVDAVRDRQASLLALSATMPSRLPDVRAIVQRVRREGSLRSTVVLVGGGAFDCDERWRSVGADGTARDAASAVELADRLCGRDEERRKMASGE